MKKNKIKYFLYAAVLAVLSGCADTGPFSELGDNRLTVLIKGTYESGTPAPFNTTITANDALVQSPNVVKCTNAANDVMPDIFMMDIAEMRLVDIHGKMHKFSNYRQALSNAMNDYNPFFNGTGLPLRNDDVKNGVYTHVLIYLRRIMFNGAKMYRPSGAGWAFQQDLPAVFAELPFFGGYDFILSHIYSYYDYLRYESLYLNRVYPMIIPIEGGLVYEGTRSKSTVLEIRLAVKNFVKKYESYVYDAYGLTVSHYYAPSDWLRKTRVNDPVMGGNLIGVARSYIPGATGSIAGTTAAGRWVIAIPTGASISDYTIPGPYAGSNPRDTIFTATTCDLPVLPGLTIGAIEPALDYFLKVEDYNYRYNQCISGAGTCTSQANYETSWLTYENTVGKFKLPAYAVYVPASGNYRIDTVVPGSYRLYYATAPNYGELISDGGFSVAGAGTDVIVSIGQTTTVSF